ncbi:MAG: 1-(5-phosphoribosyl)-5-[(5-phosphoribosylamino)methylideneamino] imidazole-4-carboxamide isomerase [Thermoleophilia bacterium]|nr:1-(5-phosphoribosyl)-5-[(5-phosphoribosylamino)methylideneamino] imidazole-4-carboxamide isomerase [Thermoleophilia bacterium]
MSNLRNSFLLYPAIDLIDGKAVRLAQGDFSALLTSDDDDALGRIEAIWAAGALALHVIDLDAARTGVPAEPNTSIIAQAARNRPAGSLLQVGGGLRTPAAIGNLLEQGVDRVLLGTLAFRDPEKLAELLSEYDEQIAVALDSRGGMVRIGGWVEDAGVGVAEAAARLAGQGVKTLLVTGIDRDGSLGGPDLELLQAVIDTVGGACGVIAAGGVTTAVDVQATRALGCVGAVVGRALLDDPTQLAALLAASR